MPLISDPGNQRSTFPTTVDSFTTRADGVGLPNVVNAEDYNKTTTAILRAQEHNQKVIHFTDGKSRRKLTIRATVNLPGSVGLADTTLTLTPAQMLFLRNQPFQAGNILLASVIRPDGAGNEYYTNIEPIEPNQVKIYWDRLTQDSSVTAGNYVVHFTVIGV